MCEANADCGGWRISLCGGDAVDILGVVVYSLDELIEREYENETRSKEEPDMQVFIAAVLGEEPEETLYLKGGKVRDVVSLMRGNGTEDWRGLHLS